MKKARHVKQAFDVALEKSPPRPIQKRSPDICPHVFTAGKNRVAPHHARTAAIDWDTVVFSALKLKELRTRECRKCTKMTALSKAARHLTSHHPSLSLHAIQEAIGADEIR